MRLRVGVLALALLASAGCKEKAAPVEPAEPKPKIATVARPRAVELPYEVLGLSGLSRDEHGAFWAPAERASNGKPNAVLRIDPDTFAITVYPVEGVPDGADLEALAWADGTRFILGTERGESARARDTILEGRLEGEKLTVSSVGQLAYSLWGLTATSNDGIEGVCQVDGTLVFATELAKEEDGRRWAPVASYEPNTQSWTAHWVALSSDQGKLAGMDCRSKGDAIEVLAIERHYDARRLLRFLVPRGNVSQRIEPIAVTQLTDEMAGPNFEGLVWMPDGSVVLLNDNQLGRARMGNSHLYFLAADEIR